MHNNTFFLASYPKSGNTWFRLFLKALKNEGEIDINKINLNGSIYSSKGYIEGLGVDVDFLTQDEIEKYHKIGFTHYTSLQDQPSYIKIHDAFTLCKEKNEPLINTKYVKGVVYLIRNPLDVTLSLANHTGLDVQRTIELYITNPEGCFIQKGASKSIQLHQPLGTWSMHVSSWLAQKKVPVHFIRYEDMKANTFVEFKEVLTFLNESYSEDEIRAAINETSFTNLKKKEEEKGFKEAPKNRTFFNKGVVGRWKNELTDEQIEKIRKANEPMMRHFNYW